MRYQHDCDECVYLGTCSEFDLYAHVIDGELQTVIARYNDDGPEYKSGLPLRYMDPELGEANARWQIIEAGDLCHFPDGEDTVWFDNGKPIGTVISPDYELIKQSPGIQPWSKGEEK